MNGTNTFNNKIFIIAEAGVNHNGDMKLALKLVDIAKESGADAVKFQTFKTENLLTQFTSKAAYQKLNTDSKESQYDMLKKLELTFENFEKLKDYCDKKNIIFLSTPFDFESADFLEKLVPIYKISSGDINNLPFIDYIAKKRKPIILSTGMSNLAEIEEAINTIKNNDTKFYTKELTELPYYNNYYFPNLTLLHCTSNYPAKYEEINLKAMLTIKEAFKLPVGYSDHSLGIEIPIAAATLQASIIEKHFTINKNLNGPDHKSSLNPEELKQMIKSIRNIEKALGNGIKKPTKNELHIMRVIRKSIIAKKNIKKGDIIRKEDISIKRPAEGINPKFKNIIIGLKVNKNIKKDSPIRWEDFKA